MNRLSTQVIGVEDTPESMADPSPSSAPARCSRRKPSQNDERRKSKQRAVPAEGAALEAAHRHVKSVEQRADAHDGPYPLWHGWALREAFLKGIEWERGRAAPGDLEVHGICNRPDDFLG